MDKDIVGVTHTLTQILFTYKNKLSSKYLQLEEIILSEIRWTQKDT